MSDAKCYQGKLRIDQYDQTITEDGQIFRLGGVALTWKDGGKENQVEMCRRWNEWPEALEFVKEFASCGVELSDPRMRYETIQATPGIVEKANNFLVKTLGKEWAKTP